MSERADSTALPEPAYDAPADRSAMQNTIRSDNYVAMRHTHYFGLSGPGLRTAIGMAAGLCFLAFGYGQGDIGGLVLDPGFEEMFPLMVTHPVITGAVVGSWNLGCLTGAAILIFLSNYLGRKGSITAGLVLEILGRILQTSSFSFGQYIAGRFVAGLGNGFIASAVPAWHVECLKTHRRGRMLMVSFGVCVTAGIALAFWVTYGFSNLPVASSASWRVPVAMPIVFLVPALFMIYFLPESPRYLILHAREEDALNVLSALNELPPLHEDNRREYLLIKNAMLRIIQGSEMPKIFSMGKSRYAHRVVLAVALQVMQQFTGINLFVQYLAAMFWNQLFFDKKTAGLLGACCSTVFFVATLLALFGMDRFYGRRGLTLFGSTGMLICMIIFAVLAEIGTEATHHAMAGLFFVYCTLFSVGWQGMSWLWAVELVPLSVRGPANALATAANWLSNWIVVFCNPPLLINITWRTYVFFGVCNLVTIPIIYLFYPETGSRSLEEIDQIFQSAHQADRPWLSAVPIARKEPRWFDRDGNPTDSVGTSSTLATSEKGMLEKVSNSGKGSSGRSEGSDTDLESQMGERRES